jgi:DegV family protein with EDD domain
MGEGVLALAAVRAARAGATLQQIVALLKDLIGRLRFMIQLDTLDYVVRGGRARPIVGRVATLLQLRPVISVEDGELAMRDRPRLRTRARERLLELAAECLPVEFFGVMHVAAAREAAELAEALVRLTGWAREAIPVVEVGMALAAHAGPGAVGIVAVREPDGAPHEGRWTVLGHELPRFEMPHVDLPRVDIPRVHLPRRNRDGDGDPRP